LKNRKIKLYKAVGSLLTE